MKLRYILLAAALMPGSSILGTVTVNFAGGAGSPLQITLPAMQWTVTDASSFNMSNAFGMVIQVNQTPSQITNGSSIGGNVSDWSSSNGSTVFTVSSATFISNFSSGSLDANGAIVWLGMDNGMTAVNGEVISYGGGTIASSDNVAQTFTDGDYEIFLTTVGGANAYNQVTSFAAVPEPGKIAFAVGLFCFLFLCLRRRRITVSSI